IYVAVKDAVLALEDFLESREVKVGEIQPSGLLERRDGEVAEPLELVWGQVLFFRKISCKKKDRICAELRCFFDSPFELAHPKKGDGDRDLEKRRRLLPL